MTVKPGHPGAKLAKAKSEIRAFARSFPETREDHPWGHSAFKVKGKTFVFLGGDATGLRMSMKLLDSHFDAMELPYTESTHYGLGKHGWVTAEFRTGRRVPMKMIRSWIEESYRNIAPKRVLRSCRAGRRRNASVRS